MVNHHQKPSKLLLMAEILHHLGCIPINNGIFTISTGAGFQPSTVVKTSIFCYFGFYHGKSPFWRITIWEIIFGTISNHRISKSKFSEVLEFVLPSESAQKIVRPGSVDEIHHHQNNINIVFLTIQTQIIYFMVHKGTPPKTHRRETKTKKSDLAGTNHSSHCKRHVM